MVENPVLEELEDSVPLIDDVTVGGRAGPPLPPLPRKKRQPTAGREKGSVRRDRFWSFFQDYLDPGYRSPSEMEDFERPSFENFLSKPTNLTDHLMWQVGSLSLTRKCGRQPS